MIRFENVYVRYDSGQSALNQVVLHIGKGEFVYIVGKTGAGKSTFIKLIYREIKAEFSKIPGKQQRNGYVLVDGEDVAQIKSKDVPYYRRKLGVVFQDFRLLEKKTVFENVAFALEVIDTPRKVIRQRVTEVLALVGLSDKANAYPNQLSGGEKQRVAIARAIVNKPKVVIADEPTGNLDPKTSDEIVRLLLKVNEEEKTTVIMVTHDTALVKKYPKRTISMDHGCIKHDGDFVEED